MTNQRPETAPEALEPAGRPDSEPPAGSFSGQTALPRQTQSGGGPDIQKIGPAGEFREQDFPIRMKFKHILF
jgi:hypothetical protein